MSKIISQAGKNESNDMFILLDNDTELSDLPTTKDKGKISGKTYNSIPSFSIAYCAKSGNAWILDSDGWQVS